MEKQPSDIMTSFSLDLYKQAALSAPENNLFVSPSSVFIVLTMIHVGARKNTLAEMTSSLKLQNMETPSCYDDMGDLFSKMMKGSKSITLNCANRLYPNADKDILETYLLLVQRYFGSTIKPLDFKADLEGSRKEINDWVEEQTKEKLKDLLPAGSITSDTGIVVVNAIYFKGDWQTRFDLFATWKQDFNVSNNTKIQIDMMDTDFSDVRYGINQQLDGKVLELFYKGQEHGLVVLLPNQIEGLAKMESKLTLDNLRETMSAMVRETVRVSLPKFKTESSLLLKPVLQALGIRDAFDPLKADFSGMGNNLFLSEVYHKTFVDINEVGTEAAATSVASTYCSARIPREEFKADHPFLYMIWDHTINAPLFLGRYCGKE